MTDQQPRRGRRDPLIAAGPPAASRIFTALLTRGAMTRAELAARSGYTPGAVTKALRPLLDANLVRELSEFRNSNGAGRPAFALEVDAEHAYLIGVKITADELVAVLTDLRAQVLDTAHAPLPATVAPVGHARTLDPDVAVDAVARLVAELLAAHPDRRRRAGSVVVAVSGDVDTDAGVVRFAPLLGWRDIPLEQRLSARVDLPVTVENDVRALTVAEQWFGAGLECRSFAVVTVGTGVGCGVVTAGELLTGAYGVAGELGHLPVDPLGPRCHCGGTGCIEAMVGEAAILDRIGTVLDRPVQTSAAVREVSEGTSAADVREILVDVGRVLGLALATVANLFGPERIVLTGETLALHDLFAGPMMSTYRVQAFGAAEQCDVMVRPLEFEHWARGAAAVGIAGLVRRAAPAQSAEAEA